MFEIWRFQWEVQCVTILFYHFIHQNLRPFPNSSNQSLFECLRRLLLQGQSPNPPFKYQINFEVFLWPTDVLISFRVLTSKQNECPSTNFVFTFIECNWVPSSDILVELFYFNRIAHLYILASLMLINLYTSDGILKYIIIFVWAAFVKRDIYFPMCNPIIMYFFKIRKCNV